MKQRRAKVSLQRPDLTTYRRLAETQRLAGMRKRPSVRGRLEDAQLIPVHERFLGPTRPLRLRLLICRATPSPAYFYSAAARLVFWPASQRSDSSAAMQPRPAAV